MRRNLRNPKRGTAEPRTRLGLPLALVFLAVVTAYASVLAVKVSNAPVLRSRDILPLAVYTGSLVLAAQVLRAVRYRGDAGLVAAVWLLAGLGLVVQVRMGVCGTPIELAPLALASAAFLLATVLMGKGRLRALSVLGWPAYVAALGVMAVVILLGQRFRGGLFLPGNYNPTELAKPLLVLFAAALLAGNRAAGARLAWLVVLWVPPMLATLMLGDLGLTLLMNAVLVVMLYAAGRRVRWLVAGVLALAALGAAGAYLSGHAHVRVQIWRDPFADPTGRGWQILQSLAALYAGGFWGCGLGAGEPGAVPIVSSDFIYAAIGEEMGYAGCVLLLCAYATLCWRGWRAAASASTPFLNVLGAGLTASLAIQMLLNVAGVGKALPLTGLTLPFISHGGSSLVTSFIIAGLLAALSEESGR